MAKIHERSRFLSRCRNYRSPKDGALWSRPVLRAHLHHDLGDRGGSALVPIASKRFVAFHEPLGEEWIGKRSAILVLCCSLRAYRMGHLFDAPIFKKRRTTRPVCSAGACSRAGDVVARRHFSRPVVFNTHGGAGQVAHGPSPRVFTAVSYPAVCSVDPDTRWSTERRTWLARVRIATPPPKAFPASSKHSIRCAMGLVALATLLHAWFRAVCRVVQPLRGPGCLPRYFHDGGASWYPRQPAYRRFVSHLCRCYSRIVALHAQQSVAPALLPASLAYCRRSNIPLRTSFLVYPSVPMIIMHAIVESDKTPNKTLNTALSPSHLSLPWQA